MAEQSKKSSRKTQPATRTRTRKRSQFNNISLGGCSINGISDVAEARKEIANALQLHRSSNNTGVAAGRKNGYADGTISDFTTAVSNHICTGCGSCRGVTDCISGSLVHHHQYCSYSASPMNMFPVAGGGGAHSYLWQPLVSQPIWSTTSPSVFPVTPASFTTAATNYSTGGGVVYNICDEQLQDQDNFNIDLGDKLANSSYTWWFDFLKSLDGGGGGGGGSTNGVLVSNNDAANQFFKLQQQELYMEDQNLPSSLEHHDWLIEPASNN